MLFFKRKTAIVCGISMEPLFFDGDIVFYKNFSTKTEISLGDIIIFKHPIINKVLIKKITSFEGVGIEVSGENKEFSDDSNYFGLIQRKSIIGIVTSHLSIKTLKRFLTNN